MPSSMAESRSMGGRSPSLGDLGQAWGREVMFELSQKLEVAKSGEERDKK